MGQLTLTNEFSICLMANKAATAAINQVRTQLPASPYRDDPPHITILRGISSTSKLSDESLGASLRELLGAMPDSNLHLPVKKVGNYRNHLYTSTSVVRLSVSPELRAFRKAIIGSLKQKGFKVEAMETLAYLPHLTIRLGVPVHGSEKALAEELFPTGQMISFSEWKLFRLEKDGDQRFFRLVDL